MIFLLLCKRGEILTAPVPGREEEELFDNFHRFQEISSFPPAARARERERIITRFLIGVPNTREMCRLSEFGITRRACRIIPLSFRILHRFHIQK
jgi:hypothetical protein